MGVRTDFNGTITLSNRLTKDYEVYFEFSDGSFGMLCLQGDGLYDYEGVRAYSNIGVKYDF